MFRNSLARWAALTVLLLVVTGCGSDDDGAGGDGDSSCEKGDLNLVTDGTLTVATGEPAFPPWVGTSDEGFDDPTSKLGYEAALVYELASELGFTDTEVTWVRTGFNEAIAPGPKDWDFNIQQYSITPERDEVVDFSNPYYVTSQALVVLSDSPYANLTSLDDLSGAKLGAAIGTTSLDFAEEVLQPDSEPNVYDENVDLEAAMRAGQIDGLVVDLPTAYYITAAQIEGSTIAAQFADQAEQPDEFGMLFADGNSLVSCINSALQTLISNGTLDEIEQTYLTQEGSIPTLGS